MPFIRGRYHINPIAGEAIEAARAAEAALSELEQDAQGVLADSADSQSDQGGEDDVDFGGNASQASAGPIHRVEIEAAELVPSHSGRAQRGFVAHVHREAGGASGMRGGVVSSSPRLPGEYPSSAHAPRPQTHVFAGHRDLISFLRDEFAKDCGK
ncbi:MAG TPA: hypothetical protein VN861_10655 [Candidatus Acidoferrales bacterium]|nr:hypothetical protein [Candidatus Acidoferrales bacterium]